MTALMRSYSSRLYQAIPILMSGIIARNGEAMNMKKRISFDQDLVHMNQREVLEVSRLKAGLTNKQVGIGMGLGEETIARYQREPNPGEHAYDLGIGKVAGWCRTVGNLLVPQWIELHSRREMVFCEDIVGGSASLSEQVRNVNKEANDVIQALLADKDGNGIPDEDPNQTLKEAIELQTAVDMLVAVARKKITDKVGRA